jgi:SAM-dependent methyltransferase
MAEASLWVERYIGGIVARGGVLDVACGQGRHIALARRLGYPVTGIDRNLSAARQIFGADDGVSLHERDLEDGSAFPFEPRSFDGVIVTNYLWRPILGDIVDAVSPSGLLLYETFRTGNARYGSPSRSDFLLRPGELLGAVEGKLTVIAYEDITLSEPARVVQRICAVGAMHPWIDQPPPGTSVRSVVGIEAIGRR